MSLHRLLLPARLAAVAALVFAGSAAAQSDPVIGSRNVATADPVVGSPPSTPCTVTLFQDQVFADFDAKPFEYSPPADCPGPWQKVVLSADFSVSMGRQFDRTAQIWLGGAVIYFGTTQEPSSLNAPSWHVERDLTDYSPLLTSAHDGHVRLDNFVGDYGTTTYDGVIQGSATVSFYPAVGTLADHPHRPDVILPLSASADGSVANLNLPEDQLAVTFDSLPTNIEHAFLDVFAQSQGGDEFWYSCVTDELADTLFDCGGTGFREAEIYVDGQAAGVAPIFPWVYTGGIDPYLWRPIPGVQTLAFEPYRVDLTPFAGVLDDGSPHTVAISIFNAHGYWATTANLLLYLDPGAAQLTGAVTSNTLAAPAPQVEQDSAVSGDATNYDFSVVANRQFTIAGTLHTSHGTVTTQVAQTLGFSNVQQFTVSDSVYHQKVVQATTVDSTTTTSNGSTTAIVHEQRSYPFTLDYDQEPVDTGYTLATHIDQEFKQSVSVGNQGFAARTATLDNHVVTGDVFDLDPNGILTGHHGQGATQTFQYQAPFGACYSRQITAESGVLTQVTDGAGCGAGNRLSWPDLFENYASSVAGYTVQLLP